MNKNPRSGIAVAASRPYRRAVQNPTSPVKAPKQERSRQSFEKALDATVTLLAERRSDAFTLAEVAQLAGVSTGSIYGRVESKSDLIRAAHLRETERILGVQRAAFEDGGDEVPDTLGAAVTRTVRVTAELLRSEAPVLSPFMRIGSDDPVIYRQGRPAYDDMHHRFTTGLLARAEAIAHPDPARAVEWAYRVVYSVLARFLGLGSAPEAAGEGDWEQILADLSDMVTAYLARPAGA